MENLNRDPVELAAWELEVVAGGAACLVPLVPLHLPEPVNSMSVEQVYQLRIIHLQLNGDMNDVHISVSQSNINTGSVMATVS